MKDTSIIKNEVLISKESFDYTKWRQQHLTEETDVRELSKKAMQYANNREESPIST